MKAKIKDKTLTSDIDRNFLFSSVFVKMQVANVRKRNI